MDDVEAMAVREAAQLAKEIGLTVVEFEGDSVVAHSLARQSKDLDEKCVFGWKKYDL